MPRFISLINKPFVSQFSQKAEGNLCKKARVAAWGGVLLGSRRDMHQGVAQRILCQAYSGRGNFMGLNEDRQRAAQVDKDGQALHLPEGMMRIHTSQM